MDFEQAKLELYIPPEYVVPLRDALSEIGAGHIGQYDHCISVTQVSGSWRPLEDARPFLGEIGSVCEGTECKVEVRCSRERIPEAIKTIKKIHPYEEPVINIVPLANHIYGA